MARTQSCVVRAAATNPRRMNNPPRQPIYFPAHDLTKVLNDAMDDAFDQPPPNFKSFERNFRMSADAIRDVVWRERRKTFGERMRDRWREFTWRIGHAYAALVRGRCDYDD